MRYVLKGAEVVRCGPASGMPSVVTRVDVHLVNGGVFANTDVLHGTDIANETLQSEKREGS